jgi:DtxR family Mn-dependent transcriptional regulator
MPNPFESLLIALFLVGISLALFWPGKGLTSAWRRFQRKSARVLGEDALKLLFELNGKGHKPALSEVAGVLQINGHQAERLLQAMQAQNYVQIVDGALELAPDGERYALQILRAHRLWERYLSEETGFHAAEWHTQAEAYEHRLTPEAADALSGRLGHPTHDPHGDPIPSRNGEFVATGGVSLASLSPGESACITHIEDEPECVYDQLIAWGLYPGLEIRLLEKSPQRIFFQVNGTDLILAPLLAANVTVTPIQGDSKEESQSGEPLSVLRPGETGRVVSISPRYRGSGRRRMMDLGVLPDTLVEVEMKSPSGDPTAYRIRGALIALRKVQADQIQVVRIQ